MEYRLLDLEDLSRQCKLSIVNDDEGTDIGSEALKVSLLYNEGKGINDIFYIFDSVTKKASGKVHLNVSYIVDPDSCPPQLAELASDMTFHIEREEPQA